MKRKLILLILIIMLFIQGISLNAQEKTLSYFNGNKYLQLPEESQLPYIAGLMDMWVHLCSEGIEDKNDGMTVMQLKTIFEKFLQENPESLHFQAASLFVAAMQNALNKLE